MKSVSRFLLCTAAFAVFQVAAAPSVSAAPITLGTAESFAVLGAATVTNTGPTVLGGNLGVAPGTAITGLAQITLSGAVFLTDAVATQALADALTAFNAMTALTPSITQLGTDNLTGLTVGVGVYDLGAALLNGVLTLDFANGNGQDIVFRMGSSLTANSGSSVKIINAGSNNNVYWQVGSSATIFTSSSFAGTVIADQSVTMQTTASIGCGRVIALVGQVALDNNVISTTCTIAGETGTGGTGPGGIGTVTPTPGEVPTPEPGTLLLMGTGLAGLLSRKLRRASKA